MKNLIIILIILAVGIFAFVNRDMLFSPSPSPEETEETEEVDETSTPVGSEIIYRTRAVLEDVTDGRAVRGITVPPEVMGLAQAGFAGETFVVHAEFADLPAPQGDDFYEGWIVRRGDDMSVISTGRLVQETDRIFTNLFTSETDLLDHDFYVLTLEPNDGDPAPADHILEGVLEPL